MLARQKTPRQRNQQRPSPKSFDQNANLRPTIPALTRPKSSRSTSGRSICNLCRRTIVAGQNQTAFCVHYGLAGENLALVSKKGQAGAFCSLITCFIDIKSSVQAASRAASASQKADVSRIKSPDEIAVRAYSPSCCRQYLAPDRPAYNPSICLVML